MNNMLRLFALLGFAIVSMSSVAQAEQGNASTLRGKTPPAIEALQKNGTKLTFLGDDGGLAAYLGENDVGKMQVFYLTPDGGHMIAGLLFRADGTNVTGLQLARMDGRLQPGGKSVYVSTLDKQSFLDHVAKAAWFTIGRDDAPMVYMVVDPQCPFCHKTWSQVKDSVAAGKFSVRIIMTSILDGSDAKAISILGRDNPSQAWMRGEGSSGVIDVRSATASEAARGEAALRVNKGFASALKLDGTPFIAYVGRDNELYSVNGLPEDLDGFLSHLTK